MHIYSLFFSQRTLLHSQWHKNFFESIQLSFFFLDVLQGLPRHVLLGGGDFMCSIFTGLFGAGLFTACDELLATVAE